MIEQLGLIGCGLMGGSFAMGLKRDGLVRQVVGYSKSPTTTERARQLGVIDIEAPSALMAVSGSDVVLIAVPVSATEAILKAIQPLVTDQTLVMDVGSTKVEVVDAAQRALRSRISSFVPAHPIAGREVSGIEHAGGDLYFGRQVVLTPTERTSRPLVERATAIWRALGAHVITMTPEAHDNALSAVSHLPHVLAFAMMNAISGQSKATELLSLAGPGFRDFTRIAASDPAVWRDILMSNRQRILAQSQLFRRALADLEQLMATGNEDALTELIELASHARAAWRMSSGPHQS